MGDLDLRLPITGSDLSSTTSNILWVVQDHHTLAVVSCWPLVASTDVSHVMAPTHITECLSSLQWFTKIIIGQEDSITNSDARQLIPRQVAMALTNTRTRVRQTAISMGD